MLHIGILGPLEVRFGADAAIPDLGGLKQQRVLARLALARGQVVSNDHLIDAVWAQDPPAKPHVTLRSYISHLRRVLEPAKPSGDRSRLIVTRAPGYALNANAEQIDAWDFELRVDRARRLVEGDQLDEALALIEGALSLWRSTDLRHGILEPFEAEIVRLESIRRLAQRLRHDALLRLGRHEEAVPSLQTAVSMDPYDEAVRGQLMVAYYRAGRQADALAEFGRAREVLLDELGLDPSPELRALEDQILRNDPALEWRPPVTTRTAGLPAEEEAEPAPTGREREAQHIAELLRQRPNGPVALAVTGEPGIGKSTLLRHGAQLARSAGYEVAIGRCHDGSQDSTLFPWITVWRDLVERLSDEDLAQVVGMQGPELSQILPEVGLRLGFTPALTTDRFTLFDALLRAMARGGEIGPVCLVLEDLHWADENTLRLLSLCLDGLADQSVALLLSWRDTEVLSPVVAALIGEISAKLGSSLLSLPGLSVDAINVLMQQSETAEVLARHTSASSLAERTGGNPLFLNELLRSVQPDGTILSSPTLRDAITSRIHRLPDGTAETLRVGAVCGHGFSETTVAEVLGLDPDSVLDQLEAALSARLIEEDPDHADQFQFSHVLFAEILLMSVSRPRQARLHTKIADALESRNESPAILAHHYLRGRGREAAVKGAEYAFQAAMGAIALFDYEGAERLLAAGVEAISDHDDDDALLADLLIELIQVRKHQDDPPLVHRTAEEAFSVAKRLGDPQRMARAAIRYEGSAEIQPGERDPTWLGYWCPPGVIIPMLELCISKLQDDDRLLPVLWAALGFQFFGSHEDLDETRRCFDEAVAAAHRTGYGPEVSLALHRRHDALQRSLTIAQRREILDQSLRHSDPLLHPMQTVGVHRARAVLCLDEGSVPAAEAELRRAQAVAHEVQHPLALMHTEVGLLSIALFQGHYADAERRLGEAFANYERFGSATLDQFGLQLAFLWRESGQLSDVLDLLSHKLSGYPGPAFSAPYAAVLAEIGRFDDAMGVISSFSSTERSRGGEGILQFLTPSFFADAIGTIGLAQLDSGAAEQEKIRAWAAELRDPIREAEGRVVSVYDGILLMGSGSYYAARLSSVLGDLDEAQQLLAQAKEHHRVLDAHPANLRVCLAEADVARLAGDGAAVDEALAEAEQWATRSGQRWRIDAWRQRFQPDSTISQPR